MARFIKSLLNCTICYTSANTLIGSHPLNEFSLLKCIIQLLQKCAQLHVQYKPCTIELICYNKSPQAWSLRKIQHQKLSWNEKTAGISYYIWLVMNTSVRDRACFENSSVLPVVYKYYWCWLIEQMLIKTSESRKKKKKISGIYSP